MRAIIYIYISKLLKIYINNIQTFCSENNQLTTFLRKQLQITFVKLHLQLTNLISIWKKNLS